jgi:hypothetical protein
MTIKKAADPFDVSFCVIPNANAGLTDIDKRSIANQSHCDVKLANMPLSRRDLPGRLRSVGRAFQVGSHEIPW